ncbi:MAG TPA: patatin-like phospholipase family protein, partial [Xanthomonadaceae bacterium]|nr:patatin-like phospholipase family protein [Xanthomonadaceae bacterium]
MPAFWKRRADPTHRELLQRLAGLRLFAGLAADALDALAGAMEWMAMPAGTVLFEQGEESDSLYVVLYGRLAVNRRDARGIIRAVGSVAAGETVGESGLLAEHPRNATVLALRDCEVLRLSRECFEELVGRFPNPMLRLARFALKRNAREARPAMPHCLALLPAMAGVDVEGFARRLLRALDVEHDTALIRQADAAGRDHAWFGEREAAHARLVYLGNDSPDWRERCVRQSDCVLLLADAARDASQARRIPPPNAHEHLSQILVLLQKGEPRIGSTRPWREAFPHTTSHAHIRGDADLARLARRLSGRGCGLVLSGGGARGFAHLGAYRALREAGYSIDCIGGSSIGAIMGAGMAADWDYEQLREVYHRSFVVGRPVSEWTLPLVSLYSGRSVSRLLRQAFGERDIEDLPLPFYCVSTNLTSGRLEVHEHGPLWCWLRASSAIPGVLPPVFSAGRVLVDGGVVDNLPVREMRERVTGEVIAIDAGGDYALNTALEETELPPWWRLLPELFSERRRPTMSQILLRAGMVNSDATTRRWRQLANRIIRVSMPDVG